MTQLYSGRQNLAVALPPASKAGNYYYIYGENTLYILSVSNDKGIIPPANAPLFRHFLTSFAPD